MQTAAQNLIFSNTETIPGMTITQSLGVVTGSTVRAKNVFKDIGAAFKNMAGGEIKAYTESVSYTHLTLPTILLE